MPRWSAVARGLVAVVVAVTLTGAACSHDDTSQPEDSQLHDEVPDTPLTRFLGNDAATTRARFVAQQRRQQELVATCMQRKGFTYVPVDPTAIAPTTTVVGGGLTRKEYVERYGFGISTTLGQSSATAGQSSASAGHGPTTPDRSSSEGDDTTTTTAFADPNQAIVQGLTDEQRRAYEEALTGPGASGASGASADHQGCQGEAFAALAAPPTDPVVSQLQPRFTELYQQVKDDPRVTAATSTYAVCMAEAGYDGIRTPQDAPDKVTRRLGDVLETGTQAEGPSYDPRSLAEVQRFELKLAARDYHCGLQLERVRLAVQAELEQRFIDENRAALERYRAVVSGGTS